MQGNCADSEPCPTEPVPPHWHRKLSGYSIKHNAIQEMLVAKYVYLRGFLSIFKQWV